MKLIINWIEMNEVKKTLAGESVLGAYVSPETKVLHVQPEGILCSSGMTEQFEEGAFDWN